MTTANSLDVTPEEALAINEAATALWKIAKRNNMDDATIYACHRGRSGFLLIDHAGRHSAYATGKQDGSGKTLEIALLDHQGLVTEEGDR